MQGAGPTPGHAHAGRAGLTGTDLSLGWRLLVLASQGDPGGGKRNQGVSCFPRAVVATTSQFVRPLRRRRALGHADAVVAALRPQLRALAFHSAWKLHCLDHKRGKRHT